MTAEPFCALFSIVMNAAARSFGHIALFYNCASQGNDPVGGDIKECIKEWQLPQSIRR